MQWKVLSTSIQERSLMQTSLQRLPLEPVAPRIDPLVENKITTPEGIKVSALIFPGNMWSLKGMYKQEDVFEWDNNRRWHSDFAFMLASAYVRANAQHVYAPTPGFNGEILWRSDFRTVIDLPYRTFLHRNRDLPADGCHLSKAGHAGAFSAGGCGIVLAAYGQDLVFAHAGRETILDRHEVITLGKEKSRPRSFVKNLLFAMRGTCPDPKKLHVWPMFFMSPDEFVHHLDSDNPDHALYSQSAREYLPQHYPGTYGWKKEKSIGIDLARILWSQLIEHGVPSKNVHMEHTGLHKDLPTTRNGGGKDSRYLVVATRHTDPM